MARTRSKRGNGEGSVYFQASRGRWAASVSIGAGRRKLIYGKTRQEVARQLALALHDLDQGLPMLGARLSLEKYLAEWLEQTIKPGRRKGTYLRYATAVRLHIAPCIGRVPLTRLGPQHVQKLQSDLLAKGLGPNSIGLVRATLSGALAQATKWGLIVRNPVPLVDPQHTEDEEPPVLVPEQAAALLAAAHRHEFEQLYTLMLATGLRIGEALGLRRPDVDLEARRLQVRQQLTILPGEPWQLTAPKSKSGRRAVPLIPAAIAAVQSQRRRVLEYRLRCPVPWPEHDLVFCDELGEPLVGRRVERLFKQHVGHAGLPSTFTPHSLRHSTGTYLTAMGVPDRVVMEILGHSNPDMTRRYQHVMAGMLQDAADRLAQIFPVASPQPD